MLSPFEVMLKLTGCHISLSTLGRSSLPFPYLLVGLQSIESFLELSLRYSLGWYLNEYCCCEVRVNPLFECSLRMMFT